MHIGTIPLLFPGKHCLANPVKGMVTQLYVSVTGRYNLNISELTLVLAAWQITLSTERMKAVFYLRDIPYTADFGGLELKTPLRNLVTKGCCPSGKPSTGR